MQAEDERIWMRRIDQLAALEIDGGKIKGQRAGGLAQPARAVVVLFGVVVPLEGKRVGTDGDKLRGRRKEGGKIKGDVLRGDIVKDETGVHDGAMAQEIARMQIVGTVGVALRHLPVAPSLTAHIGNPIACAGRDANHIGKLNLFIKKGIQHAAGKKSAKCAALVCIFQRFPENSRGPCLLL